MKRRTVDDWLEDKIINMVPTKEQVGPNIKLMMNIQLPSDYTGLMLNKENRDYASRKLIGYYPEGTSRTVENISDEIFAHVFMADVVRPFLSIFPETEIGKMIYFRYTQLNKMITEIFD